MQQTQGYLGTEHLHGTVTTSTFKQMLAVLQMHFGATIEPAFVVWV
jgi:hypothetical protein